MTLLGSRGEKLVLALLLAGVGAALGGSALHGGATGGGTRPFHVGGFGRLLGEGGFGGFLGQRDAFFLPTKVIKRSNERKKNTMLIFI